MANIVEMTIVDGLKHLDKDLSGIILCKLSFLIEMLIKLAAFEETELTKNLLCDKVEIAIIFIGLIKFHNVGVVEFLEDFNLGNELIEVADVGFRDFLDCAVGVFFGEEFGLVDGAVCAFAEFL